MAQKQTTEAVGGEAGPTDAPEHRPSIERVRRHGPKTGVPLVAVQTWRLEPDRWERLGELLPETPILELPAPSQEEAVSMRRVERWVDHHERVLRECGETLERVHLIGWSFGGVVAAELARRLKNLGVEVPYLGMVDTIRPILKPLSMREYIWHHLSEAASIIDEKARRDYLVRKGLYLAHMRWPRLGRAVLSGVQRLGWGRETIINPETKQTDPLRIAIHTAYLNYRGPGIEMPVCLYATKPSLARTARAAMGWSGYLNEGYKISHIPGGHFSLWDAGNIEKLAEVIQVDLAMATKG